MAFTNTIFKPPQPLWSFCAFNVLPFQLSFFRDSWWNEQIQSCTSHTLLMDEDDIKSHGRVRSISSHLYVVWVLPQCFVVIRFVEIKACRHREIWTDFTVLLIGNVEAIRAAASAGRLHRTLHDNRMWLRLKPLPPPLKSAPYLTCRVVWREVMIESEFSMTLLYFRILKLCIIMWNSRSVHTGQESNAFAATLGKVAHSACFPEVSNSVAARVTAIIFPQMHKCVTYK